MKTNFYRKKYVGRRSWSWKTRIKQTVICFYFITIFPSFSFCAYLVTIVRFFICISLYLFYLY